ncbi:glycosyltransferase family 9 protein [Nocardia neocaledoniensis]|uniref:glycosyltransferase family 9 protein n=1 Tax=Nocardia neocaledoniensis TaxID=236511 RepID=UPI002453DDCF|nr:glycosyltransferase family 9 protein [Nocardia neocaledoniensis]
MAVILALRALGIGDLLTALPALRALRRARPDDRLVLAAPDALRPLLRYADCVDALHPTDDLDTFEWPGPPPEFAVNLHGSGPESIAALRTARPRVLLSHAHPDFPELAGPHWDPALHEVDRWCLLLEHAGIPADPARLELAVPTPLPRPPYVIVHPGAAAPARRWPLDRFAGVAAAARDLGYRVLVTGSERERPLTDAVVEQAGLPAAASAGGEHTLDDLVHLVAGARLLVSGDTGIGHLATAVGTRSVLLFGPVSPAQWGPRAPRHRALWAGRHGDPRAPTPDPGLLAIGAGQVIDVVAEQLSADP